MIEQIAFTAAIIQVGIVLGLSSAVIIHYARHRSMKHIVLVAMSYIGLTFLTAGSIIFRIFSTGETRMYGLGMAMTFFLLGDYALIVIWRTRKRPPPPDIIKVFEDRQREVEQRMEQIEAELKLTNEEQAIKVERPIKVEIVESPVPVTLVAKGGN